MTRFLVEHISDHFVNNHKEDSSIKSLVEQYIQLKYGIAL